MTRCTACGVTPAFAEPCNVPSCPSAPRIAPGRNRADEDSSLASRAVERADGLPSPHRVIGALGILGIGSFAVLTLKRWAGMLAELRDEAPDDVADRDPRVEAFARAALIEADRRAIEHDRARFNFDMHDLGLGFAANIHTGA